MAEKKRIRDYRLTTLKNGLRVISVPMSHVDSATVMVGVGAGSRYETKRVNGLFHFIEHMAFKGTKKRPSSLAIATEIDGIGGAFNAFTDKEFTGYYIKLASKHLELAFDVLADMLTDSLFKPEEIEREKGVIVEEINMRKDHPTTQVIESFVRLLYGDNPMGWDVGGEAKGVRRIQRQDFMSYIKQLYFAPNMVLAAAGNFDQSQVDEWVEEYFGRIREKGKKKFRSVKLDQKGTRIKLKYRKTQQAHFCLGVPGYDYDHPDRFAIGVLTAVLGVGMSSRLFIQIRERRGLAYYVKADVDYHSDSGFLVIQSGVRLKQVGEAIRICLDEMESLKRVKVGKKELNKAREAMKGHLILSLEDSKNVASRYAAQLVLENKIRTPQKTLSLIDKVTAEDIQRVARDIFRPEKLNLALIGPYKSEARFKKILKHQAT
jgi:predicted Zn-dependent peptidase